MSIQSEIERIDNNVQSTLGIIADAGVSVDSNANSDDLPAAAAALASMVGGGAEVAIDKDEPTGDEVLWVDLDDEESSYSSGVQMELLWENASPESDFAAQTIILNLNGYEFIAIRAVRTREFVYCKVGESAAMIDPSRYARERLATVSASGVTFGVGEYLSSYGSTSWATSNSACKPAEIYGIKGVQ